MYQYQSVRAAYLAEHGINEDGSDSDKMTADDLATLKAKVEARRGIEIR